MSRLAILTKHEQHEFDNVPNLSAELKTLCFNITEDLQNKINALRTPTNKVGFLLQYGYFKACRRFFVVSSFKKEHIKYAAKILGISPLKVDFLQYKNKIFVEHQNAILNLLDFKGFDSKICQLLAKDIIQRVEHFTNPREVFFEILELLHIKNIEVPSYHCLSELITKHYLNYENKLSKLVDKQLSLSMAKELDLLLNIAAGHTKSALNYFTVINQSTKPKAIQASLEIFKQIKELFNNLLPVIEQLNLTIKSCEYYATWVKKAKLSQLKQIAPPTKRYLHLIAFIQHQFYLRQDLCVDLFLKCVQSSKNSAIKRLEEIDQLTRGERRSAIRHLSKMNRSYSNLIDEVAKIVRSKELSDRDKVQQINSLIDENEKKKSDIAQTKIELFEKSLDRMAHDKDYFEILEKLSTKLQLRVTTLVKVLTFNDSTSNKELMKAISYFKNKNGDIDQNVLRDFLNKKKSKR